MTDKEPVHHTDNAVQLNFEQELHPTIIVVADIVAVISLCYVMCLSNPLKFRVCNGGFADWGKPE